MQRIIKSKRRKRCEAQTRPRLRKPPPPRDEPISQLLMVEAEVAAFLLQNVNTLTEDEPQTVTERWWKAAYLRAAKEYLDSHKECRDEFRRWHAETGGTGGREFFLWMHKRYLEENEGRLV